MRLRPKQSWLAAGLLAALPGCSIKHIAVNALGNALAQGNSVYATDDDPELVEGATPFGLKTVEALLQESPRHKGLLLAAVSGFTQYAYAFVQQKADFVEESDFDRATELRNRARKLYLRALDYGLRGLEVDVKDFRRRLREDPAAALARTRKQDVGLLYWTAAAWGAAIAISKDEAELTADQNLAEALARRALSLDEGYAHGAIHDFFIAYEGGRASVGGSFEKARQHFDRSVALSRGHAAWPFVDYAETVDVARQDRSEFSALLHKALGVDVDAVPELRLTNLVAQKRARWLLGRTEELFVE
jgi:predicted anti-sigma-YlaC factor YlaD